MTADHKASSSCRVPIGRPPTLPQIVLLHMRIDEPIPDMVSELNIGESKRNEDEEEKKLRRRIGNSQSDL